MVFIKKLRLKLVRRFNSFNELAIFSAETWSILDLSRSRERCWIWGKLLRAVDSGVLFMPVWLPSRVNSREIRDFRGYKSINDSFFRKEILLLERSNVKVSNFYSLLIPSKINLQPSSVRRLHRRSNFSF